MNGLQNSLANGGTAPENGYSAGFRVRLTNFEGPFDLLLQLIFAHQLDVTEVALHQVTDDFIAYTKAIGARLELEETTAFLVIAATLLDLKAARLLPAGQVDDEEDLALLEVRDLLFARLLQYRAFKHVAEMFAELEATALRSYPRAVSLEDGFVGLLPEVMLGVDAHRFAEIAAIALTPRPAPTVATEHLHELMVSVPEQAEHLLAMLKARGSGQWASFSELVADCTAPIEIVGRFLALLELYRTRAVAFEQSEPLGALQVSWTGDDAERSDEGAALVTEHMPEHDPSYGIPDIAEPAELDADELKRVLEALLLVIDTPVTADALAAATEQPVYRVAAKLQLMADELTGRDSGIDLRHTSEGWRMYTRARFAPYVEAVAGRRANQAHPGRAGDPGRGGLPPAGHTSAG